MQKGKTYIIGTIGNGFISKSIQIFCECNIPREQRWSHVAGVFWHWSFNCWVVCESVYPNGVVFYPLELWLKENYNKQAIEFFEYLHLKPSELLKHIGKAYSVRDIARIAKEKLIGITLRLMNDDKLYCAELLSKSDDGMIKEYFKLEHDELFPIHYQLYAKQNNINIYSLQDYFIKSVFES